MSKTYTIRDNQIIIYPNTEEECNITEEQRECETCKYNPKNCGYYENGIDYPACDKHTFDGDEWEFVEDEE